MPTSREKSCDLCVIGHVTRDRIEISGEAPRTLPGGTVYYASAAARHLGLDAEVITKLRQADRRELLGDIEALGVHVHLYPSPETTEFVNIFPEPGLDTRRQKVLAVALPFQPSELDVEAKIYLLGPLTPDELPLSCIEYLHSAGGRLALDIQGYLRRVRASRVELDENHEARDLLKYIEFLKASHDEALLLTGAGSVEEAARIIASAGPREVLITSGSKGSHILADETLIFVKAYPEPEAVDTTGCGDTYFAAYLARRLANDDVKSAGHFASRVAGLKTAYHGAFCGPVPAGMRVSAA